MQRERTMKDSGIPWIGEIPEGWSIDTIGNLYALRNEKVSDKDYPPLSVTKQGIVPQLETAAKTDDGDNRKLVKVGDFAINSRSDRRGSCGISAYDGSVSLINTVITPREQMNPCFYNWLFHSELFADEFYKWGHGIVDDLWTTRWQEMKRIGIITPPLAEQHLIATFLDKKCSEIDSLIELQEQMIEELKAYKQSVITEAVTKGIRNEELGVRNYKDSGIEWIGDVPEEWEVCRIRNLGITQNGISKGGEFFGEGEPFISYSDVYKNIELPQIASGLIQSSQEEQDRFSVCKGDVFFTRTSETIEEIGFSSTCTKTIEKAVYAGFLIRFRPKQGVLNDGYSKYYFRSDVHRVYFVKEMNIVTRASLSQDLLKSLVVLLPPISEQQAIADYLDKKCGEIDELITIKQQKIESLKEYKKSVIYEYVTGKREVE
jgi:type I restriction enzyme S subunit